MQKAVSNLSDVLAREVLRYTLDVQRAGVTVSKQTVMELVRLDNALIGYIQTHNPNKKLIELHNKARATIQEHITRAEAQALSDYERVIAASAQQATNSLNTVIGAPIAAAYAEPAIIEAVSSAANVMGAPAVSWWKGQGKNTFQKFAQLTRNGFMTGKNTDAMVREWRDVSKQLRTQAETQVRTSVMSMANAAREQIYQNNKHIVKGVQAVATLDLRTSALCRARDGQKWYFDGKSRSRYPGPPPWHWNCRSTLIGILKSYDELTGKWKEFVGPQRRASMDGQVAGDLTYDDWFKGLTEDQQKDVLGPSKFKLWKEDKLSMRDMVDQNGNALTVKQLEKRYSK